jgi:hypothetical protein
VSAKSSPIRQARIARRRLIRRRVVGGAVALFVATWLLITVTLMSGHDPALAARGSTSTTKDPGLAVSAGGSAGSSADQAASASPGVSDSSSGDVGSVTTRSS